MWFFQLNNQKNGPVNQEVIQALLAKQVLSPDTLVWKEGMTDICRLADTELASLIPINFQPSQTPAVSPAKLESLVEIKETPTGLSEVQSETSLAPIEQTPSLPRRRTLVLLAVLIGIPIVYGGYSVIKNAKKAAQEAKWKREEPERDAAWAQTDGYRAGGKMFEAGNATGIWRARTESDIKALAYHMWENPNDPNLKKVCEGIIRVTGGDFESPQSEQSFVNGFVQGYIDGINDFKRRTRQY